MLLVLFTSLISKVPCDTFMTVCLLSLLFTIVTSGFLA